MVILYRNQTIKFYYAIKVHSSSLAEAILALDLWTILFKVAVPDR